MTDIEHIFSHMAYLIAYRDESVDEGDYFADYENFIEIKEELLETGCPKAIAHECASFGWNSLLAEIDAAKKACSGAN